MHADAPRNGRATETGSPKGGQRLLYWIAWTCRLLRESAGASIEEVAYLAGEKARVLDRFEDGENWPRHLEMIVAAYAEVAGLEDSLKPWQVALDLWYQHGALPMVSRRNDVQRDRTDKTQKQIMERVRRQAQRGLAEPDAALAATRAAGERLRPKEGRADKAPAQPRTSRRGRRQ